ncbi:hypothetical protein AB0I28_28670 [Phytomonospora sp. NPDC050363]|uniref:hypothetical protein n=1 Tax=Phytomonospora sp. NPDC050363 TaxID=3155642 RepID=UPI0033F1B1B9
MTTAHPNFRMRGALITGIAALPWTMIADLGAANMPIGIASLVLTAACVGLAIQFGRRPGPRREPAEGWQRTFNRVGLLELAGIAVAAAVLVPTGLAELMPAAVALVVGAHFFPLARVFGQPQYRWTGVGMCLAAGVALVLFVANLRNPSMAAAGLGTAVTLWATSLHVSLRG